MYYGLNKRNRRVCGLLVTMLAIGAMFYLRSVVVGGKLVSPQSPSLGGTRTSSAPPTDTAIVRIRPAPDYASIPQHHLFRPLVTQQEPVVSEGASHSAAPASAPVVSDLVSVDDSALNLPHTPLTESITVVGVVGVNGIWKVLVEDYGSGETRFVREGETAFGYRVQGIFSDGAILERDSQEFVLILGATIGSSSAIPLLPSSETSEPLTVESSDLSVAISSLPDPPIPEDVKPLIGDLQVVWSGEGFKTVWVHLP